MSSVTFGVHDATKKVVPSGGFSSEERPQQRSSGEVAVDEERELEFARLLRVDRGAEHHCVDGRRNGKQALEDAKWRARECRWQPAYESMRHQALVGSASGKPQGRGALSWLNSWNC
jgi:hypothetical protein